MQTLQHEPGGAVSVHGAMRVEHRPAREEVAVVAPGGRLDLTDEEGRDLAACFGELFPSLFPERQFFAGTGWYRGGPR